MSEHPSSCIHCRRDLSGLNERNTSRHVEACRKKHPYPKSKPKKHSKLIAVDVGTVAIDVGTVAVEVEDEEVVDTCSIIK